MPLPKLQINKENSKRGPLPQCTCGKCAVCFNRERQRRFREKNKINKLLGYNLQTGKLLEGEENVE